MVIIATLIDYLDKIGIKICGRFGEWKYYNMDETVMSAKKLAKKTK